MLARRVALVPKIVQQTSQLRQDFFRQAVTACKQDRWVTVNNEMTFNAHKKFSSVDLVGREISCEFRPGIADTERFPSVIAIAVSVDVPLFSQIALRIYDGDRDFCRGFAPLAIESSLNPWLYRFLIFFANFS